MALLQVDFSVDLVRALWSQPPIEAHFLDKPSLPQAVKVAANGRLTNSWHRPRDYMCRRLMRQPKSIIGPAIASLSAIQLRRKPKFFADGRAEVGRVVPPPRTRVSWIAFSKRLGHSRSLKT